MALSEPPPLPPPASLWRAPLTVFLLSLLVSGMLLWSLSRVIENKDRTGFTAEVDRTVEAVRQRIDSTVTVLRGTAGLLAASQEVDPREFAVYIERLRLRERYPGVQGIGFTQRVRDDELPALLARLRAHYGADFRFWPEHDRPERHAIVYLEPQDERNRPAMGYDMGSEATRRAAMDAARDAGAARASGKVTLVQEIGNEKQAGFLIYLPLYRQGANVNDLAGRREGLLGFVYAPLRVGDLLAGVRGAGPARLDFMLYDGERADEAQLLRDTRAGPPHDARFETRRSLDVEGRPWLMVLRSRPELEALSQRRLVPLFVLLALGASAGAAWTSFVQARERRSILEAAHAQQRDQAALRASEERERLRSTRLQRLAAAAPKLSGARSTPGLLECIEAEAAQLLDAPSACVRRGAAEPPPEGALTLPLADGDETLSLQLAPRPGSPYGDDDRLLLEQLATIGTIALRNARLVEALRENDRRKDEFLAVLAHELRNPLAPLRTSLEILRRMPEGEPARRAREVAERQTAHMVRLIDDLLDVSRITHGTVVLRRARVALADVVASAVETSRPAIDARAHRLRVQPVDPALHVDGDATRLAQIVANLLVNAANYTPAGGQIELSTRRDDGCVELSVRDDGVGIEPAMLTRIFEPFMQADRSSERAGGLGIGLMLVRRLAELHGGSVRAASAGRGLGSEFTVRLPLAPDPGDGAEAPVPAAAPAGGEAGRRILVVDDNRDAAESLAAWLALDGHEVSLAHDGGDALAAAARTRPEVVLLDIGLPVLDGYEVARRLRAAPGGAGLHLVAITGWGQDEDRRRTREAGFDLHLVKPVDPLALAGHLRQLRQDG